MDPDWTSRQATLPHDPKSHKSFELLPRAEAGYNVSSKESDEPSGPKLTGFRILNIILVAAFGLSKAVLTYQGKSAAPTMLELVLGVILGTGLYWIGLYESVRPYKWPWLLHDDYSVHALTIARFTVVCLRATFIHTGIFVAVFRTFFALVPILVEPLSTDQSALSWIKFALYFLFMVSGAYLGFWIYDTVSRKLTGRAKALVQRAWRFITRPFRLAPGGNGAEWKDTDHYATLFSFLPTMVILLFFILSLAPEQTNSRHDESATSTIV
ncbi:hypothetical protein FA95DRAFT_797121 [Auriscalpium vulgare]|uniref:Uncharacterized protein n=1 Tax=Auriscalpium vulgare TaxID=40419 RepID=A0ACB8S0A2_9AGAM|nr:hypothetical protein FA95DRAFT_797121 [Auriscalpium vulgare]